MPKIKKRSKSRNKGVGIIKLVVISYSSVALILVLLVTMIGILYSFKGTKSDCANSISCVKELSGIYDTSSKKGVFMGKEVSSPKYLSYVNTASRVLGDSTKQKQIKIDLSNQRLYAYEGDTLIYEFPVSTGKWGTTPTGVFNIWIKLRYTRMSGGSKEAGTYYNLPNVPYTMYFYNSEVPKYRGFGIHGAYWHNNFGHPMSHGCVNMKEEDVAQLYYWADPATDKNVAYATAENPGTQIVIYGVTPQE